MTRWEFERAHPRHPRGSERGGRFRRRGGGWAAALSGRISAIRFRDEKPDYEPGRWLETSREEWEQEQLEQTIEMLSRFGIDVDAEPERLEAALMDLEVPDQILNNGLHQIKVFRTEGDTPWPVDQIAQQADELIGAFPLVEPLMLTLLPKVTMVTESGRTDGASIMGSGLVQLSERVLGDRRSPYGHFMPQRERNDYWRYALVHEWGHLIDIEGKMLANRRVGGPKTTHTWEERNRLWKAKASDDTSGAWVGDARRDLSDYGRQNDNEGVAEAFAEWFLSRGSTRNTAAREYAAYYGWDKDWPK